MQRIGILLLLPLLLHAQIFRSYSTETTSTMKERRHEIVRSYYPSGRVEVDAEYRNGRREGLTREYYPDGRLRAEIPFHNGREDGTANFYFTSGVLRQKIRYDRSRVEWQIFYDQQGRVVNRQ